MKKNQKIYMGVCLIVLILLALIYLQMKVVINDSLNVQKEEVLSQNFVEFVDYFGNIRDTVYEKNGWFLLEADLLKSLKRKWPLSLKESLKLFGNKNGHFGWWPEEYMIEGKKYFKNKPPLFLYHDLDDTVWGNRIYDKKITYSVLREYLSDEELPPLFNDICLKVQCDRRYVARIWRGRDWHEDIDIIVMANLLAYLTDDNRRFAKVIRENQKILNYIIENKDYYQYFKYYEPKIVGDFLLLYYDNQFNKYLSKKARKIVATNFQKNKRNLKNKTLVAQWGDGTERVYGLQLKFYNTNITPLMDEYSLKYLFNN